MTPEEAKIKKCHKTLHFKDWGDPALGAFCLADSCMAWRWRGGEHEGKIFEFITSISTGEPAKSYLDPIPESKIVRPDGPGWEIDWRYHKDELLKHSEGIADHPNRIIHWLRPATRGYCGLAEPRVAEVEVNS